MPILRRPTRFLSDILKHSDSAQVDRGPGGFWPGFFALLIAAAWSVPQLAQAQLGNAENQFVTFLNGLTYEGKIAFLPKLASIHEGMVTGESSFPVLVIDDGLRRVFVSNDPRDFQNIARSPNNYEEFEIKQPSRDRSGNSQTQLGTIFRVGAFDKWGRRQIVVNRPRTGATPFTQAITVVTPKYCQLDVINDNIPNTPKLEWSMHVSTESVPVEVVRHILMRQIDATDFDERLRLVEFFVQAKRYKQARRELASIAFSFPGLEQELTQQNQLLLQAETAQSLDEIEGWLESGNAELAFAMLDVVKRKPRLSSNILADINEIEKSNAGKIESLENTLQLVTQLVDAVNAQTSLDQEILDMANWFMEDVRENLNPYNQNRLASFERLESDTNIPLEEKLAIAVSGWIIGNSAADDSVPLATSLVQVKPLVEKYLSPAPPAERASILAALGTMEAGIPEYVSKVIANILPPVEVDLSDARGPRPLTMELEIPAVGNSTETCKYLVQLPPAYNPYRKYPTVISLSGGTGTPEAQIDWWAGEYRETLRLRRGLAARYGYIVIAPEWRSPGQAGYEFSASEHLRVLASLRHALRRFSIDSDRVFLSGHFDGATAAWDIALAHPEHWAGVVPISARAGKYIGHYSKNAKNDLPFYFVYGERDIISREQNETEWNNLLRRDYQDFYCRVQGQGGRRFSRGVASHFSLDE